MIDNSDIQAFLQILENDIKEPIPVLKEIKWNSFGYNIFGNEDVEGHFQNRSWGIAINDKPNPKSLFSDAYLNITRHLSFLALLYCKLDELPSEIENFINLEELYIGGNSIKSLPHLVGLTQLKYLYVIEEQLEVLPDGLSSLKNLVELVIKTDHLKVIPNDFYILRDRGCRVILNDTPL